MMRRLDRLLRNRRARAVMLYGLVMLCIAAVGSALLSGVLARYLLRHEIRAMLAVAGGGSFTASAEAEAVARGAEALSGYGVSAALPPEIMSDYPPLRLMLFCGVLGIASLCIFLCTWNALRQCDRIYRDIDAIYEECLALSEQRSARIRPRGSEAGSIRRLCEGIQRLTDRTRAAAEDMQRTLLLQQDMLSDITHQMKTALAVVRLNRDMLAGLPLPEEEQERLSAEITVQLDGMELMVLETLKLARVSADAVEYQETTADLLETCSLAAERVAPLCREKNITVSVASEPETLPAFPHDGVWLCEAVENLLKNAVDHAECTAVTLTLTALPDAIRLRIADNGRGIPLSEIPHLFDRFHSGAQSVPESAGLGMAIAKRVFSAHGAEITVYSGDRGTELLAFFRARETAC